jgi:hypothetical protein
MLDDQGNFYDPYGVGSEFLRNHEKERIYLINSILAREKNKRKRIRRSKAEKMATKVLWELTRPNIMRQKIDLFFFMGLFVALIVLFFV